MFQFAGGRSVSRALGSVIGVSAWTIYVSVRRMRSGTMLTHAVKEGPFVQVSSAV